uniref:Uncharacterized protein n=1 Tax=Phaseolus vulgaris TaxID=3885 RepID=V7ANW1_PHAVU|nr:hypothetical protein PHAVU_010G033900g [Phaseolus vulgaris]ESW06273.1 hypothetical protein PHAVU_010G033900g [Phaseolus vulgaris]
MILYVIKHNPFSLTSHIGRSECRNCNHDAHTIDREKMQMLEMSLLSHPYVQLHFPCSNRNTTFSASCRIQKTATIKAEKALFTESFDQTRCAQPLSEKKKRVFFLDVNPLCYEGSKPSLYSFGRWLSLFLSQVSLTDPVIAVISLTLLVCERMKFRCEGLLFGDGFSY